jgi:hypothetical protein
MIKKFVILGLCFVFVAALPLPAFADQSIGYREYFKEGVKAFKEHDDQKAIRCFKIAQIYDPADKDLNLYLDILKNRGVVLELPVPQVPPEKSIGYRYYLSGGVMAYLMHDNKKAVRYFKIAIIFNPASKEAERYSKMLLQRQGLSFPVENPPSELPSRIIPVQEERQALQELIEFEKKMGVKQTSEQKNLPQEQQQVPKATFPKEIAAMMPPPAPVYLTAPKAKGPVAVILLSQITNNSQMKPKLQIELNSSVILEGRNIQRVLMVDEGFIAVKTINADQIEVDAQKIGTTFLHIWDDLGRHTLYLEVVFPPNVNTNMLPSNNGIQHAQPFIFTYSNDWSTYYSGKNIPDLKRQSYELNQSLGVKGETPYGFLDASGSYIDFNSFSEFDTYTIGLSQIPLEGTNNFNLRGFDALRYLSPLTMPNTNIRGVFADVDLLDDTLGLSVSHGQPAEQEFQGINPIGQAQFYDSYIDAAKLTLFPNSDHDRYSFNYATSYGPNRPQGSSEHDYSVQGLHKFNDFLTLNAEEASDSSHDASLASLKWQKGDFNTGLHFRNIDKSYGTASGEPSNQGETGVTWTTEGDFKKFTESTFVESYRDRLDFNPDDPGVYNYDANGHLRTNLTTVLWSDTDFNFIDTPGELSPQRSVEFNERLSRNFGVWNSLRGTVFGGAGYQNNHSPDSDVSDYGREDVIAGIQLPLTREVSTFANYEFDWLDQPFSGGNSNPNIINAGIEYQKQWTPKFSANSQVAYRDELGVQGADSFLSGEESVIISSGFTYNATPDMSIFADGNASKVLSHTGNPSYDDFEVHLGVRITFGGATYWDPLGTVSGIVFKDRDQVGKFVPGDEGIPGVKVKVGDKEAITDKNGHYSLQVRGKWVTVMPVLDTVPGGLIFSTPQSLSVEVFQGRKAKADFGLISQTGIYGIVFVDKNGSGVPNDSDQFIGKVKVVLDGKIIQKSDSHGAFYFRKVSPGQHIIAIDINSLALNMVPLVKLENTINVAEGTNYMFNIPVQVKQAEGGQD